MSHVAPLEGEDPPLPVALSSARAKLIYLYLDRADGATIPELADDLHIPLIALFRVLDALEEKGMIERVGGRYRCQAN